VGKDLELWKHPYWQAALTTIGEMLAFLVYYIKEKYNAYQREKYYT
jgi:hypothetical protein